MNRKPKHSFTRVLVRAWLTKLWRLALSQIKDPAAKAQISDAFRAAIDSI